MEVSTLFKCNMLLFFATIIGRAVSFRVYILRHGQTDANASGVIQGSADFSRLTELGKEQAADAFQAFQEDNIRITSIYSSPLARARATLYELRQQDEKNSKLKLLPPTETILNNLREIDFYDWEGKDKYTLQEKFPSSWRAWKVGNADELMVFDTRKGNDPIERFPLLELWERADKVWDEIFLHEQEREECDDFDGTGRAASQEPDQT